jgi:hypothetical protein
MTSGDTPGQVRALLATLLFRDGNPSLGGPSDGQGAPFLSSFQALTGLGKALYGDVTSTTLVDSELSRTPVKINSSAYKFWFKMIGDLTARLSVCDSNLKFDDKVWDPSQTKGLSWLPKTYIDQVQVVLPDWLRDPPSSPRFAAAEEVAGTIGALLPRSDANALLAAYLHADVLEWIARGSFPTGLARLREELVASFDLLAAEVFLKDGTQLRVGWSQLWRRRYATAVIRLPSPYDLGVSYIKVSTLLDEYEALVQQAKLSSRLAIPNGNLEYMIELIALHDLESVISRGEVSSPFKIFDSWMEDDQTAVASRLGSQEMV